MREDYKAACFVQRIMFFKYLDLVEFLQQRTPITVFDDPDLQFTQISELPITSTGIGACCNTECLYVTTYDQLHHIEPMGKLPPTLVANERREIVRNDLFAHNAVILLDNASQFETMNLLNEFLYQSGQEHSPLKEFSRKLLAGHTTQTVLNIGAEFLENPVVVTSSNYAVKYVGQTGKDKHWLSRFADNGYLRSKYAQYSQASHTEGDAGPGSHDEYIVIPIQFPQGLLGYLYVFAVQKSILARDYDAAKLLGSYLSVSLAGSRDFAYHDDFSVEKLMHDILNGSNLSKEMLFRRQQDTKLLYRRMLVLMIDRSTDMKEYTPISLQHMAEQISVKFPASHFVFFEGWMVMLISTEHMSSPYTQIPERIIPLLPKYGFYCGLSNEFDNLLSLQNGYLQARKAMYFSGLYHSSQMVYLYSRCVPYHICEMCSYFSSLESLMPPGFLDLMRYDEDNDTALVQTLRRYLELNQNKAQTAKELFIHPNTLKYRLNQINQILKLDLTNTDDLFIVLQSFILLRYQEATNKTDHVLPTGDSFAHGKN